GDEPQHLARSLDGDLANVANAANVFLVVDHPGLERGPLLGPESVVCRHERHGDRGVEIENLEVVLGLALEELLASGLPELGMTRNQHAGTGAVDPGLEGSLGAGDMAVPVELLGRLAE